MTPSSTFEIAVLPGDGIGVEVTSAAVEVLDALSAETGGIRFNWRPYPGGAQSYRDTGVALADETMKALEQADAILFGAMGLPDVRYPDGTEIAPQLDIRVGLDLYAGVRPIRAMAGLPSPLSDPRAAGIDFVLIREQTEGLFYARGRGQVIGRRGGAGHDADHASGLGAGVQLRAAPGRTPERTGSAGAGHLRGQGQRVRVDGLLPQDFRRAGAAVPGG